MCHVWLFQIKYKWSLDSPFTNITIKILLSFTASSKMNILWDSFFYSGIERCADYTGKIFSRHDNMWISALYKILVYSAGFWYRHNSIFHTFIILQLSEMFTVGKRTYGMSKKLIEVVVKACNTGSCWKEKKTKKKKGIIL